MPAEDKRGSRAILWRLAALAIANAMLSGCATTAGDTIASGDPVPRQLETRQLIVTLASELEAHWSRIPALLAADHGLELKGQFPLTSIGVQCVVFRVAEPRSVEEAAAELRRDPWVESVQANQLYEGLTAARSDPYGALQYGAQAILASRAHHYTTGRGVRVALIDTGVDTSHPDLRGRVVETANFVDGGERSFEQDPHGTAIAGVIGARADDGRGIYGIAPAAELVAAKACWYPEVSEGRALCSSWTLAKAVDFAVNSRVRVINMSLNGPPDALLARLLETAIGRRITVVAAAAAEAPDPGFPASLRLVIGVLQSDARDFVEQPRWDASEYLLAAPGKDILTTAPHGGYDYLSGSSLAAAHVSGAIALLLEREPSLSPQDLTRVLRESSKQVSASEKVVAGVIDVCAALARLEAGIVCR